MNSINLESIDINSLIVSFITEKALNRAFIGMKNALKMINKVDSQIKIKKFDEEELLKFIANHLTSNIKWASNVSFRDSIKVKNTKNIFVELDLFISPLKLRLEVDENIPKIKINEILTNTERNIVLLGQPGAGKTTSIKKIFLETISKELEVFNIFSFPLIIRLKELSYDQNNVDLILFQEIFNTLGLFYSFEEQVDKISKEKIVIHLFKELIERLDILIILDGFDEIGTNLKKEIVRNLKLITNSLINSRFILTSRSADYDIHIDNTKVYEICALNENQIEEFTRKWLDNDSESSALLNQLRESPYWDTTMRPLTLAHLCALYERNKSIPPKPKSVYRKIINLLLEDWSNQRDIKRMSEYAKFEVDRKVEFLSKFAFILSIDYDKSTFDEDILNSIYRRICADFELPEKESKNVVKEIESHNGLIIQTGYSNFEFAHKSLLEYFVADYLIKMPQLLNNIYILETIPNELALYISISSIPNASYFNLIYKNLAENSISRRFLKPFLSRLFLEKPDFESNILFALTNAYLINQIVTIIAQLNNEGEYFKFRKKYIDAENDFDFEFNEMDHDSIDNNKKLLLEVSNDIDYYEECLKMVLKLNQTTAYEKSYSKLEASYHIGQVKINNKNPLSRLNEFGDTLLMQAKRNVLDIHGMKIGIPDKIYITKYNKNYR